MPVPPGVLGKKLCRLGEAHPRSLKLTSWIRLLRPVMTLSRKQKTIHGHKQRGMSHKGVDAGVGVHAHLVPDESKTEPKEESHETVHGR